MKKSSIIWLIAIVVIVIGGYFWWSSMSSYQSPAVTMQTSNPGTPSTSGTPSANPTTGATPPQPTISSILTLNNSGGGVFGAYLSASNGMTLYQSTKDANNVSNCTGACATAWPPYIVSPATAVSLTASPGIVGKIGTIRRANGSLQVTYRGLPLYFSAQDIKSGDTKGEAVNGFTEVAP